MKIYTKKGLIEKFKNERDDCLNDNDNYAYDSEKFFVDGYYDGKIEEVQRSILPIFIRRY